MSGRSQCVLLFSVLFAAGIARLGPHYEARARFPENSEAIRLARSIALRGQFANPFRLAQTGPSAYLSPAFPYFLGLLVRTFGTGARGAYAYQFSAALVTSAELALLPSLTETIGLGLWPGIFACLAGLLAPIFTFPDWEVSYAGLLAVIVSLLIWPLFRQPQPGRFCPVLFGIVAGSLLLTSAACFAVLVAWFAYCVYRFRSAVFANARWATVVVLIVMLMPWTVRNYVVFHRFIPFRTALGLALEVSNNDCAPIGVRQSEQNGCLFLHSPNHNPKEAERARQLGEPQYNAEKLHETLAWITSHPWRFATLILQRIYAFWFPFESGSPIQELTSLGRRRERLTIYAMTLLGFLGIVLLSKSNRPAFLLLASWWIFFPLIYYVALFEDRYRYPILWSTLITGGYALHYAWRGFSRAFLPGEQQRATAASSEQG